MKKNLAFLLGIFIIATIAVGILVFSFDPYQAGAEVKFLFFTGSAVLAASLIGILYFAARLVINRFKKS